MCLTHYVKDPHDKINRYVFMEKIGVIMRNREKLGLSPEQMQAIKSLKYQVKKDMISKTAEIDLASLDMKVELWKDKISASAINMIVDKKYELKKQKARAIVSAIVKLKSILNEAQKQELEGLCMR